MILAAAVCGGALFAADAKHEPTLYGRLGGMPAIQAVVDDFVTRLTADSRVNRWFAHAVGDPERLAAYKKNLADLVCQASGGPCKYTGMDMTAAHHGRGITSQAFDAVVEDLTATLVHLKVPEKERSQVLGLLAPMKPMIVQQ